MHRPSESSQQSRVREVTAVIILWRYLFALNGERALGPIGYRVGARKLTGVRCTSEHKRGDGGGCG